MSSLPDIGFSSAALPKKGTVVLLCDNELEFGSSVDGWSVLPAIKKAMTAAEFKGGFADVLDILTPEGSELDRVKVLGLGNPDDLVEYSWLRLGGKMMGRIKGASRATICLEMPKDQSVSAAQATDFALGMKLSAYRFDRYKTKQKKKTASVKVTLKVKSATAAKKLWEAKSGVGDGVLVARDLVNEPANILTPIEFAKRISGLKKLGCKVDILDEKDMKKLKMNTLLAVGQGSRNPSRMAIVKWNGGKPKEKPVAFVGKGVTFDTGGISLKPGAGMGDMKGDMGGAAAVAGLMHALAARKAKANVVGVIAMVENMPDGNAQRPGDIVTSMSGQTVEVLNTDAEGRLILADALWHCQKEFKPQFMVNLATLTGAILVALGNEHAGLFSNNDELSERLTAAGLSTEEKLWRMPLSAEYDKLIDTKNADMKNIGGRYAGSITAGQFLQRFVNKTPWAHLDVAGTAMGSTQNEINHSWASGFGVRLLDRLVSDHYEN